MSSMTGNSTCGKNSQVHMPGQDQCQRNLSCKWEGVTRKLAVWTLVVGAMALMLVLSLFCSFPIATTIPATNLCNNVSSNSRQGSTSSADWTVNLNKESNWGKPDCKTLWKNPILQENPGWEWELVHFVYNVGAIEVATGLTRMLTKSLNDKVFCSSSFSLFLFLAVFQYEDCNQGRRQFTPHTNFSAYLAWFGGCKHKEKHGDRIFLNEPDNTPCLQDCNGWGGREFNDKRAPSLLQDDDDKDAAS